MQYKSFSRGFTLIELLVVVVIISISVGLMVININTATDEDQLKEEISRIQQLLSFAHEQSVIRSTEYGVRFYQRGYRFMQFNEKSQTWVDLDKDKLLRYRGLPGSLELDLYIEQVPVELLETPKDDPKVKQQSSGDTRNTNATGLIPDQSQTEVIRPQVFLLSSSEITPPFEIRLRIPGDEQEIFLEGLPEGKFIQSKTNE